MSSSSNADNMGYGFYYPEGPGYLHIRHLGTGSQGTCTLVKSATTGELLARKRCFYRPDTPQVDRETEYSSLITHSNVIKPAMHLKYTQATTNEVSVVSYWPYYNCGDLGKILRKVREAGYRCPEILVWRYLSQVLGAFCQAHTQGVCHMDAHLSNILVQWDESQVLPTLYLGDWGLARKYDDAEPTEGDFLLDSPSESSSPEDSTTAASEPPPPPSTVIDLANLPLPTLDSLYTHDPRDQDGPSPNIDPSLRIICANWEVLIQALFDLLAPPVKNGITTDKTLYSSELDYLTDCLELLPSYLLSDGVLTIPRYQHLSQLLLAYIRDQESKSWTTPAPDHTWPALNAACPYALDDLGAPDFHVATAAAAASSSAHGPQSSQEIETSHNTPLLYHSSSALLASTFRPPGPWSIAMVDSRTYQVMQVDSEIRDEEKTHCDYTGEMPVRAMVRYS